MHIRAFKGKDAENNRLTLEALALNGSLIKWEIYKAVKDRSKITWATVSRRVDALKERNYIVETGKRRIKVAKREQDTPAYGLTWKGFVASLTSNEVRNNIVKAIEKNPQLKLLHAPLISVMIKEIYTEEEIREMTRRFFEATKLVTLELESANEIEILWYIIPALSKAGFSIPEKDLSKLTQNPEFPEFLKNLYNVFRELEEQTEGSLEAIRRWKLEIEKLIEATQTRQLHKNFVKSLRKC